MCLQNLLALGLFAASFVPPTLAVDKTSNPELVAKLKTAATQLDRLALLPDDSDWVYDLTADPYYTFSPGGVVNANAATFPAVVGHGMSVAILNLGPCSMLPPHYHPRASNFVVAMSGTTDTFMIAENGARTVKTTLTPGKMTIFPQGSLHMMQNTGCENAQLVSALNNEDQGTHNVANGLFSLPPELLAAALGYTGVNINQTAGGIPGVGTGSMYGNKECLARCGAKRL